MDYQLVNVHRYAKGLVGASQYFHDKWGTRYNYRFYLDAIQHSSDDGRQIPQFYLLMKGEHIAGCYALIANDFVSRHDLTPWFACVFIEPEHRGNKLTTLMSTHAVDVCRNMGLSKLYLATEHETLYENLGWRRYCKAFDPSGKPNWVYRLSIQ